ncbi:AAA family ATPase [Fannyhessea vaginae]|uniref:AAA family ATPase n=1 Tax=Fannyhessea vaginae TaxID=82135 RepID=UPI003A80192F
MHHDEESAREILDALSYIDPACLSYQEWVDVGFALHESGLACSIWDAWSAKDSTRYHTGECARKWKSFGHGQSAHVSAGTLMYLAKQAGYSTMGEVFDWDSKVDTRIDKPPAPRFSVAWADEATPDEMTSMEKSTVQLSKYLSALFDDDDYVGYVTESWTTQDERRVPTKGSYDRTALQLRQELAHAKDLGAVLGDYDADTGAWIRFNPLDGRGVGNANVTEYRYALVESDTVPYEKQLSMIRQMKLPYAAIVTSGHKSVHAIVHIDAGTDYDLYRKRVEELYAYVRTQGFEPDTANKNPSRLSRLPGARRGKNQQSLISVGDDAEFKSWGEWVDWRAEEDDDLPEIEKFSSIYENLPALAPVLIGTEDRGILRQGHKGMLAGQSKAGKSFALLQLGLAVATGGTWLGYPCTQGRVLYVNLEIDAASFAHRVADIASVKQLTGNWAARFDILNLRGFCAPLDKLAPKIIHKCLKASDGKKGYYSIVIIDPLYKIITGDENSASEMSKFTALFDKIAYSTGAATFSVHHHSKGAQGTKRTMDRASGSGVFARDPDALLDLSPLVVPDDEKDALDGATAWRLSATLREFKEPEPINVYFRYPVHELAGDEACAWKVEGEEEPYKRLTPKEHERRKETRKQEKRDVINATLSMIWNEKFKYRYSVKDVEPVTLAELTNAYAEAAGQEVKERTMRLWLSQEWCGYKIKRGRRKNEIVPREKPQVESLKIKSGKEQK